MRAVAATSLGARMERPANSESNSGGGTEGSEMSRLENVNCAWVEMRPPLTPCGCKSQRGTLKHEAKGDSSGFPPH